MAKNAYLKIQPTTAEYPMAGAGEPAAGPFPAEALGGCHADGRADTSQDEPPSGSPEIPLCAVRHLILSYSLLSVWQARGTGRPMRARRKMGKKIPGSAATLGILLQFICCLL